MPVDVRKAKAISEELVMLLEELAGINRVHRGDPRNDLEVPAAVLEFDGPDSSPTAFGLRETTLRTIEWTWRCTFCFDGRDGESADDEWMHVACELLESLQSSRRVQGLWNNIRMESVTAPEWLTQREWGQPAMFKSILLIAESEER